MTIRFFPYLSGTLAVTALFWTFTARAQTAAPISDTAPAAYRSTLEGYKPYTDEKIMSWKESNDTAGRIGGWREYAKQAAQPESTPATPATAPKPDPHAGHAKP